MKRPCHQPPPAKFSAYRRSTLSPGIFGKLPLVACDYGVIPGDSGSADHQVALTYTNAPLGQVGPQRSMYPRHSEIESNDWNLRQQALDKGLTPMPLRCGSRPVKAMQKF